ncbi:hypothetical protein DWQ65_06415 [Treponema phagedenis]|uniref:Carboxypeptidase regulatory-like domain-containing protein n=1 Tax=Treponema phagedenis TaxID=162 RepID=A0A0B7GWR2_TREPH|nr:hypothetical protein [Treponema phagedenis]NVP24488.1 hypothetical protein [Treponema phagedenis]QEJ95506.1 hypothetical protein FUT79_10030 [Treponema phagedenis]QEJ97752.1 hypothetical protein FUT82_06920 [Treponema phagedenis]QEK01359.1 hypothetical protein FUT84_09500 [Treponema phagedenis]QEK03319.1 hypothetical protein FUT83_05530 [Treponema phagedenis]
MKKRNVILICLLAFGAAFLIAHTPLLLCYDNGDGTITCEGGFSDGSSAKGVEIRVVDNKNKVLIKGKLDKNSEFTFKRPKGNFSVIFDAGPGHVVKVKSEDIE